MSSGGRFSRRKDNGSQPLLASPPPSPISPSPFNLLTSSDPPIRRSRNLPGNPKSPPLASPLASSSYGVRSPPVASPLSLSSPLSDPQSRNTRFSRRDSSAQNEGNPREVLVSPRRNGLGRQPSAKEQLAAAALAQNIEDWNTPRKRGQTPVSEVWEVVRGWR
jgi:hypothetical protein